MATISADGAFRSLGADQIRSVVFAVNYVSGDVLVIDARTNKVISALAVGTGRAADGQAVGKRRGTCG